jgi:hypothetical protein
MKYLTGILFIVLVACTEAIKLEDVQLLNGYWQIDTVTFPDDSKKTYELSASLDFIQLDNGKGYRKKVQPALDGTFDTSDDAISFEILLRDDGIFLLYSNTSDKWEELLLQVDLNSFTVRNEAGIEYLYKRFEPLEAGQ